jgi:hypothetical protein
MVVAFCKVGDKLTSGMNICDVGALHTSAVFGSQT